MKCSNNKRKKKEQFQGLVSLFPSVKSLCVQLALQWTLEIAVYHRLGTMSDVCMVYLLLIWSAALHFACVSHQSYSKLEMVHLQLGVWISAGLCWMSQILLALNHSQHLFLLAVRIFFKNNLTSPKHFANSHPNLSLCSYVSFANGKDAAQGQGRSSSFQRCAADLWDSRELKAPGNKLSIHGYYCHFIFWSCFYVGGSARFDLGTEGGGRSSDPSNPVFKA